MIDPDKIERIVTIARKQIPNAEVDRQDTGEFAVFTITDRAGKGASVIGISRERFLQDQAETEDLVRQMLLGLRPGDSVLLRSDGEIVPFGG
jgi:hypothetical protein